MITVEMAARAWHHLSDEVLDGVAYGTPGCSCLNFASRVKEVVDLFAGDLAVEPEGLGAVVVNPFTDRAWVRAAHLNLPWHDPAAAALQQWSDPSSGGWLRWSELPRPVVTLSPGWVPPETSRRTMANADRQTEPSGVGATVTDAIGDTWVRLRHAEHPWVKVTTGASQRSAWEDLPAPLTVRSPGWEHE